jgi:hypothetical protein
MNDTENGETQGWKVNHDTDIQGFQHSSFISKGMSTLTFAPSRSMSARLIRISLHHIYRTKPEGPWLPVVVVAGELEVAVLPKVPVVP